MSLQRRQSLSYGHVGGSLIPGGLYTSNNLSTMQLMWLAVVWPYWLCSSKAMTCFSSAFLNLKHGICLSSDTKEASERETEREQ